MRQIKKFSDSRLDVCPYCGNQRPNTRDHSPSKIFLDTPYPENLPIVNACEKCNNDFSKDEAYVACIVECLVSGTVEIKNIKRKKIRDVLLEHLNLYKLIIESYDYASNVFKINKDRLENILIKLAKGHLSYELSECRFSPPDIIKYNIINKMSKEDQERFIALPQNIFAYPEVGSRAFVNGIGNTMSYVWTILQEGTYSYATYFENDNCVVKIIMRDFLCAEIIWYPE